MKHDPLESLIKLARKAHEANAGPADESAPLGFSTRVAALARSQRPTVSTLDLLERVGWRWAAGCVAVSAIAMVLHMRQPPPNPFEPLFATEAETAPIL